VRVTGDPDPANNGIFYLHTDHLSSVSAMSDANSNLVGDATRYRPFGGYRNGRSNPITDRGFTGQRENVSDLGLMYYNARFYVPGIGRFLSADTIVPNPTSPQSLNRYAYSLDSPLNFTDPSGHWYCAANDNCHSQPYEPPPSAPTVLAPPAPIFYGLPVATNNITWANGFGANWYAKKYADPNSPSYNPDMPTYKSSAGLHPGLDFGANAGT